MGDNRVFVLANIPDGVPNESTFRLERQAIPTIADGEILVRGLEYSLDPAMRGWISGRKSYREPVAVGAPMEGAATGVVIESKSPNFKPGDRVVAGFGWREYAAVKAAAARLIPPQFPSELFLGAAGMTGLTAYFGLFDVGQPKPGETVVVSGAAGATGSIVVQLAKIAGAYVVGIAGSDDKCDWLTKELGADAVINYKGKNEQQMVEALRKVCPKGIDVYFDNVGGDILNAALLLTNVKGRIVCCGSISSYNSKEPSSVKYAPSILVVNRIRMEGFLVMDFLPRWSEGIQKLLGWITEGKVKHKDTIVDGFESLPSAFLQLFNGSNTGKLLVRGHTLKSVSDERRI